MRTRPLPRRYWLSAVGGLLAVFPLAPTYATDHNNLDDNRPLNFDDAEAVAYREKTIEFGAALSTPRRGGLNLDGDAEFLYGVRRNTQLSFGLDPLFARDAGDNSRHASLGDANIGLLHNFNRETQSTPAFALRADAYLPTGRDSRGVDYRLRGIASRRCGQYGRLHLNLDLGVNSQARGGERSTLPAVILGYSRPLGYPTRFNRTLVAELGYRAAERSRNAGLVNVGIGIRQQVTVRSVFDLGLTSDIVGGGNERSRLRLVAGYATSF